MFDFTGYLSTSQRGDFTEFDEASNRSERFWAFEDVDPDGTGLGGLNACELWIEVRVTNRGACVFIIALLDLAGCVEKFDFVKRSGKPWPWKFRDAESKRTNSGKDCLRAESKDLICANVWDDCSSSVIFTGMTALLAASANAAVIKNYQFTGSAPSAFDPTTSTIASATAGAFSGGDVTAKLAGVGDVTGLDAQDNTGFDTGAGAAYTNGANGLTTGGSTQANAFANNDYFTFTVSANTGFELDLTSLTFKGARNNADAAESWALTSSIDGHTVGNIIDSGAITGSNNQAGTYDSFVVDLSDTQFQNIAAETDVEFRIYFYGYDTTVSSRSTYVDNVVLNGAVTAIPEPGSFALIAGCLALTSVMIRRRRA